MKSFNKVACKLALCLTVVVTTLNFASANSDFWRWTKPFVGPDKEITTLIITGNYAESRLLAELIQSENGQPILLLPAAGQDQIFFMPPAKRAAALQVPADELTNFINFTGMKQILILGDDEYASPQYIDKISQNQVVWRVSGNNWKKIAASAGKLLNLTNLNKDYARLLNNVNSELNYQRVGSDNKSVQPDVIEEDMISFDEPIAIEPEPIMPDIGDIELIDASTK